MSAEVDSFVAGQFGLTPDVLGRHRRRPATQACPSRQNLSGAGVRAFATGDEQRLSSFVPEKVAYYSANGALRVEVGSVT